MGLFRVSYNKREDSLINAVAVGELAGEAPAVLAIRYDEQGRGYVMGSEGFVEADGVGYGDGRIILTSDDKTGRRSRCDVLVARPVDALFIGRVVTEELAA